MARLSLLAWLTRSIRPVRKSLRTAAPVRRRLLVEMLEDRCVPSTVMNLNDSGSGSLRDAIATTPAGGIIDFQAGLTGTITLTSGELAIANSVTISGPGATALTVSGGNASRVFDITSGTATIAIAGLTIANGYATAPNSTGFGGGIENRGTLALSNCTVINNYAQYGGGGIETWVSLSVTGCTFTGNTTDPTMGSLGGAIENAGGHLTVASSSFSGNLAQQGGAIINNSGALSIDGSTFSGNHGGTGGAIFSVFATASATITNSTIANNFADTNAGYDGGGITNNLGQMTITGSTLSGNTAGTATITGQGGGLYNQDGTVTVSDSTIYGNSAAQGGGLDNRNSVGTPVLTLSFCTVSGNTATLGGGVANVLGTVNAFDTILAGNTSPGSNDIAGPLTSQGYNLVGDTTGGSGFATKDLVGTTASLDPKLGPLQNNGGPTPTLALLAGSPALGAGSVAGAPAWDQRGAGFARVVTGKIDIGAFEVQTPLLLTPTITVTAGTFVYGGPGATHAATATAVGSDGKTPVTGTFTFTYNGSSSAPATAGSYAVVATFTSADPAYANATGTATLTINPATPFLTVTAGTFASDGQPHAATATVAGVDGVTPVAGTITIAYNGSATVPSAAGTYTVVASFISSDPNYANTSATATLTISTSAATPTIDVSGGTFPFIGGGRYVGAVAIGSDGLTQIAGSFSFTYNGSTQVPQTVGTYAVVATFLSSDPKYGNATGTGTIKIVPVAPIAVTFAGSDTFPYDGQPHAVAATAIGVDGSFVNGTFTYTYNGSSTPRSAIGSYSVVATFTSGDPNYLGTTGTTTLNIVAGPIAPTIVVAGGTFAYDGQPHPDQALAYAGDGTTQVSGTFSYTYNGAATLPTAPGVYVVTATFTSSDPRYTNATGTGVIDIAPGRLMPTFTTPLLPQIITYGGQPHAYATSVVGADGKTAEPGSLTITYNDASTVPTAVGQYLVQFSFQSSDPNYFSVSGLAYWTILPAPAIHFIGGTFPYDGNAHAATAVAYNGDGVTPLSGSFTYTYNGASAAPSAAGTYTIVAVFTSNDPNYGNATATGTLTIGTTTGAPTVTAEPQSETVTSGRYASFHAAASGTPRPTVQWQISTDGGKTFANINGATHLTFGIYTDPSQDGNEYRAVFTNRKGIAATAAATLHGTVRPKVTLQPHDHDVVAGAQVTFTAAASSATSVQWQVSTDGGKTFSNAKGATAAALTFTASAGQNGYRYRAVFTNAAGTVITEVATLIVESKA